MMDAAQVLFASPGDLSRALGRELSYANAAAVAFEAFPKLRFLISTHRDTSDDYRQTLQVRVDSREGSEEAGPHDVGPVIDRIGSGDALAGAVLDGIIRGAPLQEIAQLGIAAGVLKMGVIGDRWTGSRADLLAFGTQDGGGVRR